MYTLYTAVTKMTQPQNISGPRATFDNIFTDLNTCMSLYCASQYPIKQLCLDVSLQPSHPAGDKKAQNQECLVSSQPEHERGQHAASKIHEGGNLHVDMSISYVEPPQFSAKKDF